MLYDSNNSAIKIPMKSRKEINFTSHIKPWILIPNNVNIISFLKEFKDKNLTKKGNLRTINKRIKKV